MSRFARSTVKALLVVASKRQLAARSEMVRFIPPPCFCTQTKSCDWKSAGEGSLAVSASCSTILDRLGAGSVVLPVPLPLAMSARPVCAGVGGSHSTDGDELQTEVFGRIATLRQFVYGGRIQPSRDGIAL